MIVTPRQVQDIARITRRPLLQNAPLSRFTTFRIGGPADLVVEPETIEELSNVLDYVHQAGLPVVVLGSGSNVLFGDKGLRGVLVRLGALRGVAMHQNGSENVRITAAAGEPLPYLLNRSVKAGWRGLESLWGIPATVGGAVVTNAGSGGISLGDLLTEVKIATVDGDEITLPDEQISFSYRSMKLPPAAVVVEATIGLRRDDPDAILADLHSARERRRTSQPVGAACAGCIFKNPSADNPAGAIIDRLGFKGMIVGGAQVSPVHANFIVNRGSATAHDVLALMDAIRTRVGREEQIELDHEIRIVTEEGDHV